MEALLAALRLIKADVFTYYTKAHGYHWNVEGMLFDQFHNMFSDIYEDAYGSIDTLAEWIRIFGKYAPFDVTTEYALSNVKYDLMDNTGNPFDMLQSLLASNDVIIAALKSAFNVATGSNEQGVANFIAERIDAHEKWRWKISSTLKSMGA